MSPYAVILIVLILLIIAVSYLLYGVASLAWEKRKNRLKAESEVQAIINAVLARYEQVQVHGVYEEMGPMKSLVESAIRRVEKLPILQTTENKSLFAALLRTGNSSRLVKILQTVRAEGAQEDKPQIDREIATLAFLNGDWETAQGTLHKLLKAKPDDLECLNRAGQIYYLQGQFDEARKAYTRVLNVATRTNDENGMALGYASMGVLLQTTNELKEAEYMQKQAMGIFTKLERQESMADGWANLGLIYHTRGDLHDAEDMFKKALDINEKMHRQEAIAQNLGMVGLIMFQRSGDIDDAERMLRRAIKINERLGRISGLASAYGNLGLIRAKKKDFVGARDNFSRSLSLFQRLSRPKMVKKIQGFLAQVGGATPAETPTAKV